MKNSIYLLKQNTFIFVVLTILLNISATQGHSGSSGYSEERELLSLRGSRYCEIFLLSGGWCSGRAEIYNTIGLNECPGDIWNPITSEQVKKEMNVKGVILNGPRYWTMDKIVGSIDLSLTTIGGLEMRKVAEFEVSLMDLFRGSSYVPRRIERHTTWIFSAGRPIYELIDPAGRSFVMQSYSLQKVDQTEGSLSSLGSRLHLPTGWSFRMSMLTEDLSVKAIDDVATIVRDEFENTYQLKL